MLVVMKNQEAHDAINKSYEHGFVTEVECDQFPLGLDESVIQALSAKKQEPDFALSRK